MVTGISIELNVTISYKKTTYLNAVRKPKASPFEGAGNWFTEWDEDNVLVRDPLPQSHSLYIIMVGVSYPLVFETFQKCGKLKCKSTFNKK